MATPIVLSQTFINGQWLSYHPQTTATAVETSATHRFVTDAQIATFSAAEANAKAYTDSIVQARVAALVGSAPEALDTLGEIAEALKASDGAHEAILQSIGEKAAKTYVDAQLAANVATTETRFKAIEAAATAVTTEVGSLKTAVTSKADAASTTAKISAIETSLAKKLEAASLPTTSFGTTAPATAVEGSIFLKTITAK